MQAWFWWYTGLSLGGTALLARWARGRVPRAGPRPLWQVLLLWLGLSAVCGLIVWSVLGCTVGWYLDGENAVPRLEAVGGCLIIAPYWAAFVILMLLPGYALLYSAHLALTPANRAARSLADLAMHMLMLAAPGIVVVTTAFAGIWEVTPSWRWNEALKALALAVPSFWLAVLLPRLISRPLRLGSRTEGNAGSARGAV